MTMASGYTMVPYTCPRDYGTKKGGKKGGKK
jgi:hypothetical protein